MTTQQTEGDALPPEIQQLLNGEDLTPKAALVFELVTVGASGWPHVALLSVGEVVALDQGTIGLALWPGSTTTENLRNSGLGVLQVYHAGAAFRIRLEARPIAEAATDRLALFATTVRGVVRDAVSYARLTSGPTIELADTPKAVGRWQAQVAAIREAAAA